jgi:hypothetical protein
MLAAPVPDSIMMPEGESPDRSFRRRDTPIGR